jgi:hypothetical protein
VPDNIEYRRSSKNSETHKKQIDDVDCEPPNAQSGKPLPSSRTPFALLLRFRNQTVDKDGKNSSHALRTIPLTGYMDDLMNQCFISKTSLQERR